MLRSLRDIERYRVSATDGDVGGVVSFLFDDQTWSIRHLALDSGGLLATRSVLLSPSTFREADHADRRLHVALTTEEVKGSPSLDTDAPVSRQRELARAAYHGYPSYWGFAGSWDATPAPPRLAGTFGSAPSPQPSPLADAHLRSTGEVRGYRVQGLGQEHIGHVDDFIVDDATWVVRYLVVDTGHWWVGKRVLVAPHWVKHVRWDERRVCLDLTGEAVRACPPWDPNAGVNRRYEQALYDYYGRLVYWEEPVEPSLQGERDEPSLDEAARRH